MPTTAEAVTSVSLPGLRPIRSGKVREVFDLGDTYAMIATDRVSAFDVVLPNGVPDRGKILNQLSAFWFEQFRDVVPNHMITIDDQEVAERFGDAYDQRQLAGRTMIVKKCEPILLECVARGYLAGSLYQEYLEAGGQSEPVTLHDIDLPAGLQLCERLPETLFTPATKAEEGHDINISYEQAAEIVGGAVAETCRGMTLDLFHKAASRTEDAGIILADTKLEFGLHNRELMLIDEVFTPDSSRYWPADEYEVGKNPPSHDKQIVRDYLETTDWDKTDPGPMLPDEIVTHTRDRYLEIFRRITGFEPKI